MKEELQSELGSTIHWGTDTELELQKIPLGIPTLDRALNGGIAKSRVSVFVGERSAGKTVLAYLTMISAQKQGLPTFYIDVERAWDPEWAATVGVDPSKVMVIEPRTGEEAFDALVAIVRSQPGGVVVVDSLAAMTAKEEVEDNDKGMEQRFIGLQARLINRGIRTAVTENTDWAIIAINQLRSSVGVTYGNPETLPGGKGQEFYAWQVVRVRRGAWIEEGNGPGRTNRVGYRLKIQLEKNKQGPPFAEAEVPFYFARGVDELAGLVDLAVEIGIVEKGGGGYYTFGDHPKIRGMRMLTETFRESEEMQAELQAALESHDVADF